jgi:hypothetical protein
MYPPGQSITVRNDGVGLVSTAAVPPLVVGHAIGATANTLRPYSNPNTARDELESGPALELVLAAIASAGRCLFLATEATTAGTASAVTAARVDDSTGTITLSGTYDLELDAKVEITTDGTLGAGRFRYTLDGVTFGAIRTIPAGGTFLVPGTRITLTFVPGDGPNFFETGDTHSFTTAAAHYTTANLTAAKTALLNQIGSRRIRRVAFAGRNADASDGAAMAAAVAVFMADLEAEHYFARALMDGGDESDTEQFADDFAAFADDRVGVTYGDARVISRAPFEGYSNVRQPILRVVAERAFAADLSENLGRKASGPLVGVTEVFHDEGINTAFDAADRFITLRTYRGEGGFYVTNGFLRSPAGSDFLYWDWGLVVDELCEGIVESQSKWTLAKLRALTDGSGNLSDDDASRVEQSVRSNLRSRLVEPDNIEGFKGHVSGLGYTVDRTNDFLATRTLLSTGNAVPLSPVEGINTTVGLTRSL